MPDREEIISNLMRVRFYLECFERKPELAGFVVDALALLKEQEAEIRQLRLALDIVKGTCKGINVGK